MKYYCFVLLWLVALPATAANCELIANDYQRLSCYDLSAKCNEIKESRQRLACFDNNLASGGSDTSNKSETADMPIAAPPPAPVPEPAPVTAPEALKETASKTQLISAESGSSESDKATEQVRENSPPISSSSENLSGVDEKARKDDIAFPLEKPRSDDGGKTVMRATIVALRQDPFKVDHITLDNDQVWRESVNTTLIFKVGQTVRIEKGMFGSNMLWIDGIKKRIKVKRIR